MGRGEISWKRRDPDGQRWEVYAHREGGRWAFYARQKRYDNWQRLDQPSLEDWLALLDGVERRIPRRLIPPDEGRRVRREIRERFPDEPLED